MSEMYTHDEQVKYEGAASQGDIDESGQLALGLFIGVIVLLLAIIYAFAMAA